jgi:hypothetical protein
MGWVVSITPRPRFNPGKRTPSTHCIGGWVGLRAGLDTEAIGKILCLCRLSNPGNPVCSQDTILGYPITPATSHLFLSCPTTRHEGAWGERGYSSYSYSTSALDGGEWSESRPGRPLALGKEPPVPILQEAGWAPEPAWTQRLEEKSFAPAGDRTPIARSSSP